MTSVESRKRSRRVEQKRSRESEDYQPATLDEVLEGITDLTDATNEVGYAVSGELYKLQFGLRELQCANESTAKDLAEDIVHGIVSDMTEGLSDLGTVVDDSSGKIAVMIEDKLDETNKSLEGVKSAIEELTEAIRSMHETMRQR